MDREQVGFQIHGFAGQEEVFSAIRSRNSGGASVAVVDLICEYIFVDVVSNLFWYEGEQRAICLRCDIVRLDVPGQRFCAAPYVTAAVVFAATNITLPL